MSNITWWIITNGIHVCICSARSSAFAQSNWKGMIDLLVKHSTMKGACKKTTNSNPCDVDLSKKFLRKRKVSA